MIHLVPSLIEFIDKYISYGFHSCKFLMRNGFDLWSFIHEFLFHMMLPSHEYFLTIHGFTCKNGDLVSNEYLDPFDESLRFVKIEAWFNETHLLFWIWLGSNPFMNLSLHGFLSYPSSFSYSYDKGRKKLAYLKRNQKAFAHPK